MSDKLYQLLNNDASELPEAEAISNQEVNDIMKRFKEENRTNNKRRKSNMSVSAEKYDDTNTAAEIQRTHVMKKKFSLSRIVSAAACIAAVAAVPVIVSRFNTAHINTEDETTSASDVPEITEPVLVTEIKEDSEKTEELSYDKFPEPFLKFYYVTTKSITDDDTRYFYDRDGGKFEIRFLKDKEFENQINSEIAELIASMPSDFEFPETAPSYFSLSNPNTEDFGYEEGEIRELYIIPNVTNGYFSFMLAIRITDYQKGFERYEYARSLVYDLIEKKKINTLNEFLGEDDSEALIQKYCKENEMPGEITGFANFNIICSNDGESFFIPFDRTFAVENNIPFSKTRDFSEILDEGFTTELSEKSVINWGTEHITYNEKGCSYDILESSSLYPDSWCEKHNSIKKVIMEDMLRDFVDNDYDMSYIESNQKMISDEILELQSPNNLHYIKNCYLYHSPYTVMLDAESLKKINITDMFTEEGIEYIYHTASEKEFETYGDEDFPDEDMSFNSKEEFIEMLNEDKITCSVDEMKEANMISVWLCYNKSVYTHTATLEINLPADMMNSRYFDYDKYCEYNGE